MFHIDSVVKAGQGYVDGYYFAMTTERLLVILVVGKNKAQNSHMTAMFVAYRVDGFQSATAHAEFPPVARVVYYDLRTQVEAAASFAAGIVHVAGH